MNISKKIILPLTLTATLIGCGGGTTPVTTTPVVEASKLFFKPGNVVESVFDITMTGDQISLATPIIPTAGDFNNDGHVDVILSYPGIDNGGQGPHTKKPIRILAGDSNGNFTDQTTTIIPGGVPENLFTRTVTVADFNGDGADDIFIGDANEFNDNQQTWGSDDILLLSNGGGQLVDNSVNFVFTTLSNIDNDQGHYTHGSEPGDVDGDGDIDLLLSGSVTAGSVVMRNDGAGNFTEVTTMATNFNGIGFDRVGSLWSIFIDADHKDGLDIVNVTSNEFTPGINSHAIFLNNGTEDYTAITRVPLPTLPLLVGPPEQTFIIDINSDGWDDLVLLSTLAADAATNLAFGSNHYYQIYVNNADGTGTFTDETATRFNVINDWTINFTAIAKLVDFNGDGKKELAFIVGNAQAAEFKTYVAVNGVMTRFENGIATSPANYVMADFNNDGLVDILGTLVGNPDIVYIEADAPVVVNADSTISAGIGGTDTTIQ